MAGSATTATVTSPSTHLSAEAWLRSDSALPKNCHRITAPTTATTVISAMTTPRLTVRRPVVIARCEPVHSPPSKVRCRPVTENAWVGESSSATAGKPRGAGSGSSYSWSSYLWSA